MAFLLRRAPSLARYMESEHARHYDTQSDAGSIRTQSTTEPFPNLSQTDIMDSQTQYVRRKDRDTGFPEPFNDDRNTTLPYPGADLSGNAVISMDSLMGDPFAKTSRRHRLSKHKRTVSRGKINQPLHHGSAVNSRVSVIDTSLSNSAYNSDTNNITTQPATAANTNTTAGQVLATPTSAAPSSVRASGEDTDAFSFKNHDEETPPSSPEMGSPRKSGLFRRLRGLSRG